MSMKQRTIADFKNDIARENGSKYWKDLNVKTKASLIDDVAIAFANYKIACAVNCTIDIIAEKARLDVKDYKTKKHQQFQVYGTEQVSIKVHKLSIASQEERILNKVLIKLK